MTVDVNLMISGLCMFVPDPDPAAEVLHALVPKTADAADADSAGRTVMQHLMVLIYDRNCLQPPTTPASYWDTVPVDGHRITVGASLGGKPDKHLDAHHVVKLAKDDHFDGVDPDYITRAGEQRLNARIEILAGQHVGAFPATPIFCLVPAHGAAGGSGPWRHCQPMAEHVPLLIKDVPTRDDGALDVATLLGLAPLGSAHDPARSSGYASAPHLPALFPRGRDVQLLLVHAMQEALPVNGEFPNSHSDNSHFIAYYDLVTPRPPRDQWMVPMPMKAQPQVQAVPLPPWRSPSAICSTSQASFA